MQGLPTVTDPDGFYFTPLTFNAAFVFSIRALVRTTRRSGGREGACAILFIGHDSEIILVSNVVRLVTYHCCCNLLLPYSFHSFTVVLEHLIPSLK